MILCPTFSLGTTNPDPLVTTAHWSDGIQNYRTQEHTSAHPEGVQDRDSSVGARRLEIRRSHCGKLPNKRRGAGVHVRNGKGKG